MKFEAPEPNTIGRLWINLHECAHPRLHYGLKKEGNVHSRIEAEADLEVLRILDEEGIIVPASVLMVRENTLFTVARDDEQSYERHPTMTKALNELRRRRRQCTGARLGEPRDSRRYIVTGKIEKRGIWFRAVPGFRKITRRLGGGFASFTHPEWWARCAPNRLKMKSREMCKV